MTEPIRMAVTQLKDLLPLAMWKLVHAGLVAETGVSIDIVLNRQDEKGRYIQLRVLPESARRNPFCSHLRKWREVEALCFGCQQRSLDGFRRKYEHLGGGDGLPYVVETCHAGLFRIVFPLRVHDSLVVFVVVHALRQAGNEGVVMHRLRTFPERANLGGRRKAISLQTAMPHLADVRGFSPRAWFKLVEDLRGNVRRIEERLTESYRRRCAEAEERLLFELTEMLPPAHEVTRERLGNCMDKIAERIATFCNLTSFAYLRRAREGEQLEAVGTHNWPQDLDLDAFADCPSLPIVAGSETRPLQPGPEGPDRAPLEECSTSGKMLAIAEQVSCIYVCPRAMGQAKGTGLVSDMLFFGKVDPTNEGLVEGLESKRSAFEKITRHLSSKLDALYRILHQQQLFREMGHEISAPMSGMLLELSYVKGLHECVYGKDLPTEVLCAFDLLTYYVKHVDHKRRNWLYAYGPEGKPNLDPKPHPIGEILQEAVNVYRPLANREGIVFVQDFYFSELPTLFVDRELVHSVFANLLDNAIKYTVGQAGPPPTWKPDNDSISLLLLLCDEAQEWGRVRVDPKRYRQEVAAKMQFGGENPLGTGQVARRGLGLRHAAGFVPSPHGRPVRLVQDSLERAGRDHSLAASPGHWRAVPLVADLPGASVLPDDQPWFAVIGERDCTGQVRRCYTILRKHRDAFTTLEPRPLVPTEIGGVFANAFPVLGKTVYTLYNSRHRTVRGEVLRVPRSQGTRWHDEWSEHPAAVRFDGAEAVVSLEIGPHAVGCIVATP